MGKLFGTDGVRGLANLAPMDSETVMLLGRAIAQVMLRSAGRHRILIGKDTRVSGYMLETALSSGIASMGVDVLLVGPLPTPGVAFMTRSMRADAGAMISASHNSYEDNGIKFFGPDGFKLPDATEDEIERLMEPGSLDKLRARPEAVGKAFRIDDALGRYTVYLKNTVERSCSFEGLKVVLDTANGAAYRVAPLVFSELGADTIVVGDKPDGKNINFECGSLHPEVISTLVKQHGADLGIAFDGDADRVILCDETGEVVDGDLVLAMAALDAKQHQTLRGDGVVGTVMSNFGLEKCLEQHGLKLYRAAVGDRYVLADMLARGLNIGGEQSGHIIFLDHNTTGDGLLTALQIISILIRSGKPLSHFRSLISPYPQQLINIPVKSKPPLEGITDFQQALKGAESRINGTGRILVRYSGTENKARVMVECEDATLCQQIAEELASVLVHSLG